MRRTYPLPLHMRYLNWKCIKGGEREPFTKHRKRESLCEKLPTKHCKRGHLFWINYSRNIYAKIQIEKNSLESTRSDDIEKNSVNRATSRVS